MSADYQGVGAEMTTFEAILIGLGAWSVTSVIVALGFGAMMKHCSRGDDELPAVSVIALKMSA